MVLLLLLLLCTFTDTTSTQIMSIELKLVALYQYIIILRLVHCRKKEREKRNNIVYSRTYVGYYSFYSIRGLITRHIFQPITYYELEPANTDKKREENHFSITCYYIFFEFKWKAEHRFSIIFFCICKSMLIYWIKKTCFCCCCFFFLLSFFLSFDWITIYPLALYKSSNWWTESRVF